MKNFYTFLFVLFSITINAQGYYYNGSEKIEIDLSESSFIFFDEPASFVKAGFDKTETFSKKGFSILENKKENFSMKELIGQQKSQLSPAYKINSDEDFKMFPTKTIRVKLLPNHSQNDLSKILTVYDIAKIEKKYGILRIHINDIYEVLNIANKIYESGIAEFSLPDFYIPIELNQVNDPLYPLQFQLNNTGQVIDGVAGVNDIDCNAPEAWNITLGNSITVAIFDEGLENHEDIGTRLIGGFTPATNGTGEPEVNGATHGMNSAGVIAASHNDIGVRGVAPEVDLLSVNIFAGGTTNGDIADGIQWAINNGADVLSNSWSFFNAPCDFTNIDIENAIQDAVTNGRNGDGAVVVFSSGNDGGCVNYPARNENVISVGAVDNRGNLFNYSSRGSELDLVAPSGETNYVGNIRTLDRMGNTGREAGHYEDGFGGTSASCPVVSGVAALVLSVNPNLTQQEVRDILTNTATDMGVGGFDNNFGNGRVNAFAAVQEALGDITISGPDLVCSSSSTTFNLQNAPATVNWTVSSNINIISFTNTSITVEPISSTTRGEGFIEVNGGSRKEVYVGKPFATAPSVPTICTNNREQTEYILPASQGATSYQLISSSPNLTINGTTNYSFTDAPISIYFRALVAGNYTVTIKTTNSCGTTTGYFPVKAEYCSTSKLSYSVYPNPASEDVLIEDATYTSAQSDLYSQQSRLGKLYDFSGNLVKTIPLQARTQITKMEVSNLKSGLYFLKIQVGADQEVYKIIVAH